MLQQVVGILVVKILLYQRIAHTRRIIRAIVAGENRGYTHYQQQLHSSSGHRSHQPPHGVSMVVILSLPAIDRIGLCLDRCQASESGPQKSTREGRNMYSAVPGISKTHSQSPVIDTRAPETNIQNCRVEGQKCGRSRLLVHGTVFVGRIICPRRKVFQNTSTHRTCGAADFTFSWCRFALYYRTVLYFPATGPSQSHNATLQNFGPQNFTIVLVRSDNQVRSHRFSMWTHDVEPALFHSLSITVA